MEVREKLEMLKVLHMLTQVYSVRNEVTDLANMKIIELLKTL